VQVFNWTTSTYDFGDFELNMILYGGDIYDDFEGLTLFFFDTRYIGPSSASDAGYLLGDIIRSFFYPPVTKGGEKSD